LIHPKLQAQTPRRVVADVAEVPTATSGIWLRVPDTGDALDLGQPCRDLSAGSPG
jgi:hypothetical protein